MKDPPILYDANWSVERGNFLSGGNLLKIPHKKHDEKCKYPHR